MQPDNAPLSSMKPPANAERHGDIGRAEGLELSNDIYTWMLDGAKGQCGLTTDGEGWAEVARRLQTLRRLHERNLYKPVPA